MYRHALVPLVAALAACSNIAPSPPPAAPAPGAGFVATPLSVMPLTGDAQREAVIVSATLAVGASAPLHTHPGDCIGAVVEGDVEMRIPGQEPRRYTAGQSFTNPRGTVHQLVNVGTAPARYLSTLIVDKGQPRTVPQAAPAR